MSNDEEFAAALRVDLERRIAEISAAPPETFGHIGAVEWTIFCAISLLLPMFLVWCAA